MPAPIRSTLLTYPTAQDCVAAIDRLYAAYKIAHKRNATADLFCSHQFSTEALPKGVKRPKVKETYDLVLSIRPTEQASAAAVLTPDQRAEMDWFLRAAGTLTS